MSYSLEYLSGLENIFPVFTRMHGEIYISSYSFEKHLICPNKSLQWCPYGLPSIDRVVLNLAKISWLEIVGFCPLWQQLVDIQSEKKKSEAQIEVSNRKVNHMITFFFHKKKTKYDTKHSNKPRHACQWNERGLSTVRLCFLSVPYLVRPYICKGVMIDLFWMMT